MLVPTTDYALGDSVGRYRLLGEVARGGMGIVYVAAAHGPAGFSKLVALKELRPDFSQDEDFLTMFLEEARMAARLSHPNIVQTNDVDEHDGRHFIAMEYLEGQSLYHAVRRFSARGGFPQRMALAVLRDTLAALDYAHELCGIDSRPLGFVHRDVSPQNIFVTYEGHTKVIDFGIAKARDSSLQTKTGVLKGRIHYMAPEQLVRRVDRRADLFSVGVVLFELLSGRRMWKGLGELDILAALTRGEIPRLATVAPDVPAALAAVCDKALAPRPEDRYPTAAKMRDAIDQHLWATGGAPRNREIGDAVSHEFAPERQRTRALIEGALARLSSGEQGRLEALDFHDGREGTHGARRGSMSSSGLGHSGLLSASPSSVSRAGVPNTTPSFGHSARREPSLPGVALPASRGDTPMMPTATPSLLDPMPPDDVWSFFARRRAWLVAGALALVFIVTTAIVALEHAPPSSPDAIAPAQAALPSLPAAAPRELPVPRIDDTIMLSIGVTPSTAQIYIDGELMPSNPFMGRFLKAGGTHRVRAAAPGYLPRERTVSFADNVMIDLTLNGAPSPTRRDPPRRDPPRRPEPQAQRPAPAPPPRAAAPVVEAPARSDRKDISPRGEWEPPRRRAIDTNNPYGEDR